MSRRLCYNLALAVVMGILSLAARQAGAQEAEQKPAEKSAADNEKTTAEKSKTTEKSAPERATAERGNSYSPQRSEMLPPIELRPISRRITLKLADDSRVVYEAICQQAGISVLFDPDYSSRRMSVDLNNVSLEEALQTAAIQSKTFWRPVTSTSILVASDNPTKRKELEQQVLKAFYLPDFPQSTDLQDIVNMLRALLQIDRVQQVFNESVIIVRATPDQLALAQKLINDLTEAKKKVGEYRLEFRVSELEGEKKLNSKIYTLLTQPRVKTMLRTGNRVPIQTGEAADKTNPDKKGAEFQYLDVGQNIDCVVESTTEHAVALSIGFERGSLVPPGKPDDEVVPSVPGQPVVHQVRSEGKMIVELDKPTIVLSSDDPRSNHTFQVEVTATRIRQKD